MRYLNFIFLSLLTLNLISQNTIPNGSFENWSSSSYLKLDNYETQPGLTLFRTDTLTTTRSTDHFSGNYAIRLESFVNSRDTAFGFFTAGDFDRDNGYPYSQRPDSLIGYYKCDVKVGDSAFIVVRFSSLGVINSFAFRAFTGIQNSWTRFAIPITLLTTPDSMFIGAVSSNAFSGTGIQHGSMLMLDSLHFVGTGITQQILNGDFENWTNVTYEEPDHWKTTNAATSAGTTNAVSKTTDSHIGAFALRVETIELFGDTIGFVTNGQFGDTSVTSGQAFNIVFDTLVGYYKYSPIGLDTAGIGLTFYRNGNVVGGAFRQLSAQSSYAQFKVPFVLPQVPDTLRIDIITSINSNILGSTLFIDDLKLNSIITSLDKEIPEIKSLNIYPNPAKEILNLTFEPLAKTVQIEIIDAIGRLFEEQILQKSDSRTQFNLERLNKGTYYLRFKTEDQVIYRTFIKQ